MGLDARGYISIGELVVYAPLAVVVIFLLVKQTGRKMGWFYLLLLSIVRVIGGTLHIVTETTSHPSTGLFIATGILESIGLSPLMLSTLAFLGTVADQSLDQERWITVTRRALHILNMVAVALVTIGGSKLGSAKTQDEVNSATNFRHIGSILFLVLYGLLVLLHAYFWSQKRRILKYRRMLLTGISCALPFLLARILYSVLSSFAPAGPVGAPPTPNSLSQFNSLTGSWVIYLFMSVLAEIAVVCIYLFVGLYFPIHKDYKAGLIDTAYDSDVELNRGATKPLM